MQQLIVIEGPTASGKTSLAIELARQLNTVVLSADSRQFYTEVSIGTAKPTVDEMNGITHYFIDSHSLLDPVSAGRYEQEALDLLTGPLAHLPYIILVGGSGMFIDALCIGLDPIPKDDLINQKLRNELEEKGLNQLLLELNEKDAEYFNEVDKSNSARVIRALEVIRLTGKTYSELRQNKPAFRPFHVQRFVIEHEREILYNRINLRVDQMVDAGLFEEVKRVVHLKLLPSLQTVGYKEVFDFFDGKYTKEMCIEKIKQHTRNYAKRQLTWFRKHEDAKWIPYNEVEIMSKQILEHIGFQ